MSIGYAWLNIGIPHANIRGLMQKNETPEKLTEVTVPNLSALQRASDNVLHLLGPNVIKRPKKVSIAKRVMERMFDIVLPNHASQLPISKMIQAVMK